MENIVTPDERKQNRKETLRRFYNKNKDKINSFRRELRKKKRNKLLQGRFCPLCEMVLEDNNFGIRIYCRDCVNRFKDRTRNHSKRVNRAKPKETLCA